MVGYSTALKGLNVETSTWEMKVSVLGRVWRAMQCIFLTILLGALLGVSFARAASEADEITARGLQFEKTLLKEGNRRLFLTRHRSGHRVLVMLHDTQPGEPLLKVRWGPPPEGDPNGRTFFWDDAEIQFFNRVVLPVLLREQPNSQGTLILHYHATTRLQPVGRNGQNYDQQGIEQPMLESDWQPNPTSAGGAWTPLYNRGKFGSRVGTWFVPQQHQITLQDALALRAVKSGTVTGSAAEAQAASQAMAATEEAARKARVAATLAARKKGFVYKEAAFWQSIGDTEPYRRVFEGHFDGLRSDPRFMNAFVQFVQFYSGRCNADLPAVRDRITVTVTSESTSGGSPSTVQHTEVDIDPRFTPHFKSLQKEVEPYNTAEMLRAINEMLASGRQRGVAGTVESTRQFVQDTPLMRMARFFDKVPCRTASMLQFRENLLAAATGQPSLQDAGRRIPNAEAESDRPEGDDPQRTFATACLAYYEALKHPEDNRKWCNCLNEHARKAMSAEELKRYTDDFASYQSDVVHANKPHGDPRWRLYQPVTQCRT